MRLDDFHRVDIRNDAATGLRAIFALHDLTLGPALGGIRRWAYAHHGEALADVVRLARGMTAKNASAALPFGGGKAVIMAPARGGVSGPPAGPLTRAELLKLGEWIDDLGGDYVAAEDVGMCVADLATAGERTRHVTGVGRGGRGGDPGPRTALGVLAGMRVVAERIGSPDLRGLRVAVQGLGNVGMALAQLLHKAGATLIVADINSVKVANAVRRFGAATASVDAVLLADVDIVAPCALGGAITKAVAERMSAKGIAGSANNQLAEPEVAELLHERGIRYAPDYVINAGGVISAGLEYLQRDGFNDLVRGIGPRLARIFDEADASGRPEAAVADATARAKLAAGPARARVGRAPIGEDAGRMLEAAAG